MPALLINIQVDDEVKLDLFKVTLGDLRGLFNECHVKSRGAYKQECIAFTQQIFSQGQALSLYQDLPEDDWVKATLNMAGFIKSRSIFLYFEDHRLVSNKEHLNKVITGFDEYKLDYLCYSFFVASALGVENLLPLNPEKTELFDIIQYSRQTSLLIGKISPKYCASSLVGIYSVAYFKALLSNLNVKRKMHSRILIAILARLFPYPRYKRLIGWANQRLGALGINICIWPAVTPFNLEQLWFETVFSENPWQFGVLASELFANYDDDNEAYRESMIKRGLYPFTNQVEKVQYQKQTPVTKFNLELKNKQLYDCTYYSRQGRIRKPPVIRVFVEKGKVVVTGQSLRVVLESGSEDYFYSNKNPVLHSQGDSNVTLSVFDEGLR